MPIEEWEKKDNYYLQGPGSWTICKISICGEISYELWNTTGRYQSEIFARTTSAEQAVAKFDSMKVETLSI